MSVAPGPVAIPAGTVSQRIGQLAAALDAAHPDGVVLLPVLIDADGARSLPDVRARARIGMAARGAART